jgi:hypothetical protein
MGRDEKQRFKPNKSIFGLQIPQRLKNEKTPRQPKQKTEGTKKNIEEIARKGLTKEGPLQKLLSGDWRGFERSTCCFLTTAP